MTDSKWLNLQLFAGEGAGDGGGDGAGTGESAVDAGQQRLRELGVPEDKIQRQARRARGRQGAVRTASVVSQQPAEQPTAAAETPTTEEPKPADTTGTQTSQPPRATFEELMKDPEYNREMQRVVQSRLRSAKGAEEAMGKLAPALELLARKHGLDPGNVDYEALAAAISDDDSFYEEKAVQMGVSLQTAKQLDQQERQTAREQRQTQLNLEEQKMQNHFRGLEQQADAMKAVFPGFDLRTELQNPVFARLTSPNVGLSVEDAYHAVHRKEIQAASMQVAAQKTAEKLANSIQSGMDRPRESGASATAPSVSSFDYSKASREQRASLKAEIRRAAVEGRKVYPGQFTGK